MVLAEDMLKGNLLTAVALGATALVLPKVLPELSPPLRKVVTRGVSLFLESESEAEGGIIDRLADAALKNVLEGLSDPGSPEDGQKAAQTAAVQRAVEDFKRTARIRARRYGRDEADRLARYRRHLAALRRALNQERSRRTGGNAAALKDLSASLSDEAQPSTG